MKPRLIVTRIRNYFLFVFCFLVALSNLLAEGSKDFRDYPGYRLFYNAEQGQQLKVFAAEGETINLGASHVGISGGFITVYRPNGTLHYVFNGTDGLGIINNDVEELAGPTGGGTTAGSGYIPATVAVGTGQSGVWTVRLEYPTYSRDAFSNLMNNAPWDRTDQPIGQRVVLAWDITVSQNGAGNMGGTMVEGRVYSNEYISIQNGNDIMTSPSFYILSKDGFQYKIDFKDTDPWGFPIFSNSTGLVTPDGTACYQSSEQTNYNRSDDPEDWTAGNKYLYEPQAPDQGNLINNKIFFNLPDPNMPAVATVTDMKSLHTHNTWLYTELVEVDPEFDNIVFQGIRQSNSICTGDYVTGEGKGGFFKFNVNTSGTAKVSLDFNANGSFDDPEDRAYFQRVDAGANTINWDGKDGAGTILPATTNLRINYKLEIRAGEIHIMMLDVENNPGGVSFTRMNGLESPSKEYFYDHSSIGGPVSGDGVSGNARATVDPFVYTEKFGNNRLLDYWSFIEYSSSENGGFAIDIISDCSQPILDFDRDLIPDFIDLDDDNDGIPDFMEYCNPEGDFVCLPGGIDLSADEDEDNIPNYLDSSDPAFDNNCVDANGDGECDQLSAIYDTDGDGVPDHLDLDSDNDGITDLVEAGHLQADLDGNGVIDGEAAFFGQNGLYNPLASDPDLFTAFANYNRFDSDADGIPDHDDLDSDNDGIHDIVEANFEFSDTNGDGRIDDGQGNPPTVSINGLAPIIDPIFTGIGVPLPPDTDLDGVRDWHDLDSDNDGINDVVESIKPDADQDGIIGTGMPVVDTDGKAMTDADGKTLNTTSRPTNTDEKEAADFRDLDADEDGINDVDEADLPDLDQDGKIGTGNPIVNEKGQIIEDAEGTPLATISNPEDTDSDLKPDFQDIDRDGDGILDSYECPGGWPCINTDEDLLPDVDDLDSDDDKLLDKEECPGGAPCPDINTNRIDNFLEYNCNPRNTPNPSKPIGGGQFCEGSPITLSASGDTAFNEMVVFSWTGPNDFEYLEKTPANTNFPVELSDTRTEASGTYELVLETGRGCQSEPLKVVLDLMEKPLAPVLEVEQEKLCAGEPIQLEVNTLSGSEVSYVWFQQTDGNAIAIDTTDIATLIIDEAQAGNTGIYTTAVSINNCISSISNAQVVKVTTPIESPVATSSATILNPACEGESVTLSVPFKEGARYEWMGPNNFTSTLSNPTLVNTNRLNNGNYNVLISFEGCSVRTKDVTVMVNTKPITPTLKMEEEKQCEGEKATLKIIEPVSYPENSSLRFNWYTIGRTMPISTTVAPNLDLLNLSEDNNGEYFVEVSLLGCESAASNVQTIEVQPQLTVFASSSATIEEPGCAGGMVMLTGSLFADATYAWYGPNGLIAEEASTSIRNASPSANGKYSFEVTVDGCPSTSEPVSVKINPKPAQPIIALDNTEPCTGENVSLSITNINDISLNNTVTVDWYNLATSEIVASTDGLVWNLENLNNIDEGSYYGVLNIDGCASESSNSQEIITQPGLAPVQILSNAEANVSPLCEGDQVNMAVPFEEGVSYQWYGPSGIINHTNNSLIIENAPSTASGEYYVIREKAGCTRESEAIRIKVGNKPATPEFIVSAGLKCLNGEVTFSVNNPQEIPGGSEVMYSWYHVQTNEQVGTSTHPIFTLTNLTAANNGTYYVVLTVDGCTAVPSNVGQVVVQQPTVDLIATASAGADTPVCEGTAIAFNVPFIIGASYEWYGPNGFTSDSPNPGISAVGMEDAGKYYAVITSNVCPVLTNELNIVVKAQPEVPNLVIDGTQRCEGEIAAMTITQPTIFPEGAIVNYEWFAANTDVSLAVTQSPNLTRTNLTMADSGPVYVVVTQDGCTSQLSNTVDLEVSAIPNELAFISEEVVNACDPGELMIDAIQPMQGTGQWSSNANISIVDPLNPSAILLDVPAGENMIYWSLSYKGCKNYSVDSLLISGSPAMIAAQDDSYTIDLNGELAATNVVSNDLIGSTDELTIQVQSQPNNGKLTFENGMASYQPDLNFFGTDVFTYEICSSDCPDRCDEATVQVKVVDNATGTDCFAPNVITPNGDGMNDYLRIPCIDSRPQSQLKVFNRWGDLVHETNNYGNDWAGTFDGKPLPNGTYFYLIKMSDSPSKPMQGYFTIVR